MKNFYNICLFVVILGVFLFLAVYFFPSSKREISAEIQEEGQEDLAIYEKNEPENKTPDENNTKTDKNANDLENLNENSPEESEKTELKETAETKTSFKIEQKPVSWGYSSSKNRNIDTIIIHSSYNALGGDRYSVSKLIEEYREYGVSPHYLIDRSGNVYQLVGNSDVAYHAGESKMPDGRTNVNSFSLGIEIITTEDENPSDAQYASLINLIKHIKEKYKIGNILGHNQIAPARKTDPWNFNWSKISSVK